MRKGLNYHLGDLNPKESPGLCPSQCDRLETGEPVFLPVCIPQLLSISTGGVGELIGGGCISVAK